MRTTWIGVVVGLLGVLGAGCKSDVKYYCDEDTSCLPRYPDRPYCDLTGEYEPDGVRNTCVANPFDASGPDASTGDIDAMMPADAAEPPELLISSTSQDFGAVVEGQASAGVSFTVTNTGGSPSGALSVVTSGTSAGDFTTSGDCQGATLQPAADCTVLVTFAPQSPGSKSANLDVSASPGGDLSVSLTGDGIAMGALSMTPASYTFSNTNITATSSTKTFTVTNTGGSTTGMLAVSLSNTTDFTISTDNCDGTSLTASATCQVIVQFNPSAVGSRLGSVIVQANPGGQASSSAGGTGTASITVSKTGSGAAGGTVSYSPAGIACGGSCAAEFSSSSVTLSAGTDTSTSFAGWSGAGCSGSGTCNVNMTANQSVTASFLTNQCTPNTTSCSGSTLTVCDSLGQIDSTSSCPLGCHSSGTHCNDVDPSNGLATYLDMSPSGGDVVLPDGSAIDTDTGGVRDNNDTLVPIDTYEVVVSGGTNVRVLRVKSISIGDTIVSGTDALAIVSDGDITITGALDVGGRAIGGVSVNGPGGGAISASCSGRAWGEVSGDDNIGGSGGGGFGTAGGNGGSTSTTTGGGHGLGTGSGDLIPLHGGCPGGAGGPIPGGGAGGAVQLVSRTGIRLQANGETDASGGGGRWAYVTFPMGLASAGLGGGAGGGILLEAPLVVFASGTGVHANGGGGGCRGVPGGDGTLTTAAAPGATCSGDGDGGDGVSRASPFSQDGADDLTGDFQSGGGGGGGRGLIRINTSSYDAQTGAIVSPIEQVAALKFR